MTDAFSAQTQPGYAASANRGGTWAAALLLLFMVIGLVANALGLWRQDKPVIPADTSWEALLDGQVNRQIAADLATFPLPKEVAALQRGAGWLIGHDLGDQVRQGCPGWLFLTEELEVRPDRQANAAQRVATVQRVQQHLAQQGIALVVAVVPDKSRIASAQLCQLQRSAALQSRASDWVGALQQAGVIALDLNDSLGAAQAPMFLQTDTHWNEAGAHQAARQIAAQIHAMPLSLSPTQVTRIISGEPQPRPGDLLRLAGVDWLPPTLAPGQERDTSSRFDIIADPNPAEAVLSDDDLFGDGDLPSVALLGSSFSRTSSFADFLAHELTTPVPNFAKDGGGFSVALHDYLNSPAYRESPPRLIIWEIPERVLDAPLSGDRPILQ